MLLIEFLRDKYIYFWKMICKIIYIYIYYDLLIDQLY